LKLSGESAPQTTQNQTIKQRSNARNPLPSQSAKTKSRPQPVPGEKRHKLPSASDSTKQPLISGSVLNAQCCHAHITHMSLHATTGKRGRNDEAFSKDSAKQLSKGKELITTFLSHCSLFVL
jgi:hypothetical protein